ncbi:hypothetical protein ACJZ2D_005365 [Fusarium nematophilum]
MNPQTPIYKPLDYNRSETRLPEIKYPIESDHRQAARKGNLSLSRVLLSSDIASKSVLERALCEAINMGDSTVCRDIDPNIGLARILTGLGFDHDSYQGSDHESDHDADHDSLFDFKDDLGRDEYLHEILYLLVGAWANLDSETALKLCSR